MDTPKSLRSHHSQRSLDVVSARAQYSTSILELATKVCFLLRQERRTKEKAITCSGPTIRYRRMRKTVA